MATERHTGRSRAPTSHAFHDRAGSVADAAAPTLGDAAGLVGGQAGTAAAGRRIDAPHHDGRRPRTAAHTPPPATDMPKSACSDGRADGAPASLLHAHADDLVHNLQAWGELLDRRESELHAAMALQENRERSFRLWSQSQQQQLQQLEREALRLREELKQQARRLALTAHPDAIDTAG